MAALALASAEADDVFEAVASHLRRPPFSKAHTAQDLRDGRDLKALLYEVCADIDAARAPRDAADAAPAHGAGRPSTKRPRPATSRRRPRDDNREPPLVPARPRGTQEAHLQRAPRAAHPRRRRRRAPREIKGASTLAFRAIKAQAGKARPPLGGAPLIERVVEWRPGPGRGAAADRDDGHARTRLAPKRTVAQLGRGRAAPRRRPKSTGGAVRGHPPDGARRRHAARPLGLPAPS